MGIDGPTLFQKSGYVLLIMAEVCLKKLAFWANFRSCFFRENIGSFKQEIHICPCF